MSHKSITFNFEAQKNLSEDVKNKMKTDRADAQAKLDREENLVESFDPKSCGYCEGLTGCEGPCL